MEALLLAASAGLMLDIQVRRSVPRLAVRGYILGYEAGGSGGGSSRGD